MEATREILQPYSVDHFNTLPDLYHAKNAFKSKKGLKFVNNVFKPLVLEQNLESTFGIGLLHRHLSLKAGEKLLDFNNIAFPWEMPPQQKANPHNTSTTDADLAIGGTVLPCSWLLTTTTTTTTPNSSPTTKLMPYEFFWVAPNIDLDQINNIDLNHIHKTNYTKPFDMTQPHIRAFLDAFIAAAKHHDLDQTVALHLFPYPGYIGGSEVAVGRANINLRPHESDAAYPILKQSTDANWFFDPGFVKAVVTQRKLQREAQSQLLPGAGRKS